MSPISLKKLENSQMKKLLLFFAAMCCMMVANAYDFTVN